MFATHVCTCVASWKETTQNMLCLICSRVSGWYPMWLSAKLCCVFQNPSVWQATPQRSTAWCSTLRNLGCWPQPTPKREWGSGISASHAGEKTHTHIHLPLHTHLCINKHKYTKTHTYYRWWCNSASLLLRTAQCIHINTHANLTGKSLFLNDLNSRTHDFRKQ